MHDLRVRLLLALMTADDAEGAEAANAAVNQTLNAFVDHNYDLYAGRNGIPSIRTSSVAMVRLPPVNLVYLSSSITGSIDFTVVGNGFGE
jgi:hypothetical protein